MHNEGFGKKWIEKILGKVDKDQGVANAGKVLGIGADGQVVPVEQSGGGGSLKYITYNQYLEKYGFIDDYRAGICTGILSSAKVGTINEENHTITLSEGGYPYMTVSSGNPTSQGYGVATLVGGTSRHQIYIHSTTESYINAGTSSAGHTVFVYFTYEFCLCFNLKAGKQFEYNDNKSWCKLIKVRPDVTGETWTIANPEGAEPTKPIRMFSGDLFTLRFPDIS